MTIAMAFKCKDGTIVATDRQGTRQGMAFADVDKMFPIKGKGLVAFATRDMNWVKTFLRQAEASKERTPIARLREAASKYDYKALELMQFKDYPGWREYAGIYATHDRLYSWNSGNIPEEETQQDRVVLGEGIAVSVAETFIGFAEFGMKTIWRRGTWSHYSTRFAARFCVLLLTSLEAHANVHGNEIYELKKGREPRSLEWKSDLKGRTEYPLHALIESVWSETTPKQVFRADDVIHFLPLSLRKAFEALYGNRDSWD